MTAPAQVAGGGVPILGPLSPIARMAVIGTVALAIVAIALDFVVHADLTLVFIVAAAAILGLAWIVGALDGTASCAAGRPDRGRQGAGARSSSSRSSRCRSSSSSGRESGPGRGFGPLVPGRTVHSAHPNTNLVGVS